MNTGLKFDSTSRYEWNNVLVKTRAMLDSFYSTVKRNEND